MAMSLADAAAATGVNRSTLFRAYKSGRMSAASSEKLPARWSLCTTAALLIRTEETSNYANVDAAFRPIA
jgi:hypothetical protein